MKALWDRIAEDGMQKAALSVAQPLPEEQQTPGATPKMKVLAQVTKSPYNEHTSIIWAPDVPTLNSRGF